MIVAVFRNHKNLPAYNCHFNFTRAHFRVSMEPYQLRSRKGGTAALEENTSIAVSEVAMSTPSTVEFARLTQPVSMAESVATGSVGHVSPSVCLPSSVTGGLGHGMTSTMDSPGVSLRAPGRLDVRPEVTSDISDRETGAVPVSQATTIAIAPIAATAAAAPLFASGSIPAAGISGPLSAAAASAIREHTTSIDTTLEVTNNPTPKANNLTLTTSNLALAPTMRGRTAIEEGSDLAASALPASFDPPYSFALSGQTVFGCEKSQSALMGRGQASRSEQEVSLMCREGSFSSKSESSDCTPKVRPPRGEGSLSPNQGTFSYGADSSPLGSDVGAEMQAAGILSRLAYTSTTQPHTATSADFEMRRLPTSHVSLAEMGVGRRATPSPPRLSPIVTQPAYVEVTATRTKVAVRQAMPAQSWAWSNFCSAGFKVILGSRSNLPAQ